MLPGLPKLDHRGPFLGLGSDEFAQIRRRALIGTLPNDAYLNLTSGSDRTALIPMLSFWMISTGVPFGAPMPPAALAS